MLNSRVTAGYFDEVLYHPSVALAKAANKRPYLYPLLREVHIFK
jgi:hypothetical protein